MLLNKYEFIGHSTDKKILENPEYILICDFINRLIQTNIVALGAGYCLSTSDLIRQGLKQLNIESKLVECQASIIYNKYTPNITQIFIGFENVKNPGELDTHIVVVTQTNPPILIDGSISHKLPKNKPVIVEPINKKNAENILIDCEIEKDNVFVLYREKFKQSVPRIFQQSIIDRVETDSKIFKEIETLKKLNYIGIILSLFALINVLSKIVSVIFFE
jgi:hypothetical protein